MATFRAKIDLSSFERAAKRLGAAQDQVAFTLALTMNEAVKRTRRVLVERTWPQGIKVRNRAFIGAALRTRFAAKKRLRVEIYDRFGRGNLLLHAKGGVRRPMRGHELAVPAPAVARGARGVRQNQRPANLKGSFRIGNVLYARARKGVVKVMYYLIKSARIKKRVRFYEDFQSSMRTEMQRALPAAVVRAMSTRR